MFLEEEEEDAVYDGYIPVTILDNCTISYVGTTLIRSTEHASVCTHHVTIISASPQKVNKIVVVCKL